MTTTRWSWWDNFLLMFVGPDSSLLRLLMATGRRAPAGERAECGLDGLLAAVSETQAPS